MLKKFKAPLWLRKLGIFLAVLGPGLITSSADNDAPGIATYSMAGSIYGYKFLFVILVVTIGEVVIQEIAARMGVVTGKGTADLIRERFGVKITTFSMFSLLLANLGTTVAQIAGVAASAELFGISRYIAAPLAAILVSLAVLRGSYKHIEKILIALSLTALSYIITVFLVKPPWGEVLRATFIPQFTLESTFILAVLATIGTTITPWGIFFMQSSVADKGLAIKDYPYTKIDATFGAAWGNVVSAFIVISTAVTLYVAGIHVDTAEQAALALAPLAGNAARILFSAGLLGASLLALSVLPLSTTYAFCEAFGFERGLNRPIKEAPTFYGIYLGITGLSVLIVLIPGIPLFPIMWLSQTLNAFILPVLLYLVIKLSSNERIMGQWKNTRLQNILATGLMVFISLVTVALVVASFWNPAS
ncbi:MAG TPA: Nramp family divalent metal transporter [Brevefilum fermentans]|jgi:NRAMP (natural resistance-associated macrophage protein)-like metal ion transporter|uniref:Natural resistance-associated macrophage protein n=1 Tax=Candidatus Brevifilum fermentans TaxID=1986204 RepID=A0A1Y6K185_9CHLR|nr:Nramp family divalent metal transporter [Brevefilum fermentans]MDI9566272.1 Nramp family divalent metal transporter [Chloroflexota bacterium]OQB84085.1 MAG: Divalent metal cation transporter MntH [Chloroflexi bacterium ADurb.Bin120]SMX53326.1 Natural resistance-associated macrophage protein [Brevefilum fermentans]HOM67870.1 Nramp family divalent metal transporter [Brevefilum fermentans]HPX95289.1 Nramp family divalent metal transporter [Brevefilum fermentans]